MVLASPVAIEPIQLSGVGEDQASMQGTWHKRLAEDLPGGDTQ